MERIHFGRYSHITRTEFKLTPTSVTDVLYLTCYT